MNKKQIKEMCMELNLTEQELDGMWNNLIGRHTTITALDKSGKSWRDMNSRAVKTLPNQEDLLEKREDKNIVIKNVIKLGEELYPSKYRREYRYYKNLESVDIKELELRQKELLERKKNVERIAEIDSSKWKIEKYLKEDYKMILDRDYLKDETQIKEYFGTDTEKYFDCGQGYYSDYEEVYICIGDKYYLVGMYAEIGSSKQDRGDRLYWIEKIEKVTYKEIKKPLPILVKAYNYSLKLTASQKERLDNFTEKLINNEQ